MIVIAKQDGSQVTAYDENGFRLFSVFGSLVSFSPNVVVVREHGLIKTYDEKGNKISDIVERF